MVDKSMIFCVFLRAEKKRSKEIISFPVYECAVENRIIDSIDSQKILK